MPIRRVRSSLRRHCCFSTFQLAEKHLERAKHLLASRKRQDAEVALSSIDAALELWPGREKALEMKAHALLSLRRYKDVVEMLHGYVPSLIRASPSPASSIAMPESPVLKEKLQLLPNFDPGRIDTFFSPPVSPCNSISMLRQSLAVGANSKKLGRPQQWRYLVLGQACFYLGMLEDALVLLQNGKRTLSAILRLRSNSLREDNFPAGLGRMSGKHCHEGSLMDAEKLAQMLGNIKFLLQRRTAAMAALDAGLYSESVHHFSKIIDSRKGSPCRFIADCYLHRAIACQATGRVAEAIADCNRTLALHPNFARALTVRASLYESVKCYSECLLDLQQLKIVYEATLRYQMMPEPHVWALQQQLASAVDVAGELDYVNGKIAATRQKLSGSCTLDAYTILDMPASCTMDDVKRAYIVLSLKHRPDMATNFIDRFELLDDGRNMEMVREEVRASAHRLSLLIHNSYTIVLSCITEERNRQKQKWGQGMIEKQGRGSSERQIGAVLARRRDVKVGAENTKEACTDGKVVSLAGANAYGGGMKDEESELHSCNVYSSIRGADLEDDACDFCQPFGGLTTTALAGALSQALLLDPPFADTSSSAPPAPAWVPDWSIVLPHTLKVP